MPGIDQQGDALPRPWQSIASTSCDCLYRPPRCTLRCRRWSATAFSTAWGDCAPAALSKKMNSCCNEGNAARSWSTGKATMVPIIYRRAPVAYAQNNSLVESVVSANPSPGQNSRLQGANLVRRHLHATHSIGLSLGKTSVQVRNGTHQGVQFDVRYRMAIPAYRIDLLQRNWHTVYLLECESSHQGSLRTHPRESIGRQHISSPPSFNPQDFPGWR